MVLSFKHRLIQIVRNEDWLMTALEDVRLLNLPDWYIAAGAIRNTVWNVLHGYNGMKNIKDIDVVYFDASDKLGEREKEFEKLLKLKNLLLNWDVVNQARLQYASNFEIKANSSCESIAYWSETSTCVGVRLEMDGSITICAPHGLDDLMNLVVRPIPKPYQDLELYRRRIQEKNWRRKWPRLIIENPC